MIGSTLPATETAKYCTIEGSRKSLQAKPWESSLWKDITLGVNNAETSVPTVAHQWSESLPQC